MANRLIAMSVSVFTNTPTLGQSKIHTRAREIIKSSKAFCETDECSPAAKQIIALLTSLLEASSTNSQLHSTESIDEHRRQHSIVIANLPESANGSAQTRVREDTKHVKDILDQLEIEAAPITVYRMGKRGENSPRLLKVEMPTKQHTRRILQTKNNLSNSQVYSQVRIRASLTPEDLAKRAELIKKCNEMRTSDPDKQHDFVVWRGQIIRRAEIQDKLDEEKEKANT
ncbi:hypothetical protein DdX_21875 [Ditylenchus destructor]|uniref:Uncharacterized protein n=1 Tax=Ditylenchus destructor TaxID=166010 RepID=A0AAD4MF17_9BILA|nr:hypothetical protein DdX_21875 [Ditylenchus destructor]